MTNARRIGWFTVRPLIFNDPIQGENFVVPAGESCTVYSSVKEAIERGVLNKKDEFAVWAAEKNIQRGYKLVLLRGKLRGVAEDSIEYVSL